MRHELRTADGHVIWEGDTDNPSDVARLRHLLTRHQDKVSSRAAKMHLRAVRRQNGLCIECGEPTLNGRARCILDLTLAARRQRERRARWS